MLTQLPAMFAGFDYVVADITNWPRNTTVTDVAVIRPTEVRLLKTCFGPPSTALPPPALSLQQPCAGPAGWHGMARTCVLSLSSLSSLSWLSTKMFSLFRPPSLTAGSVVNRCCSRSGLPCEVKASPRRRLPSGPALPTEATRGRCGRALSYSCLSCHFSHFCQARLPCTFRIVHTAGCCTVLLVNRVLP